MQNLPSRLNAGTGEWNIHGLPGIQMISVELRKVNDGHEILTAGKVRGDYGDRIAAGTDGDNMGMRSLLDGLVVDLWGYPPFPGGW
jgi:hypothetical protein